MGPAYHPEWLVTLWLTTPGLNWLNPHYVLIFLGAGLVVRYFMKRRDTEAVENPDAEDLRFKHLLLRKKVIEEQMEGLEAKRNAGEITESEFAEKVLEYRSHLEQVTHELQQYT